MKTGIEDGPAVPAGNAEARMGARFGSALSVGQGALDGCSEAAPGKHAAGEDGGDRVAPQAELVGHLGRVRARERNHGLSGSGALAGDERAAYPTLRIAPHERQRPVSERGSFSIASTESPPALHARSKTSAVTGQCRWAILDNAPT